MGRTDGRAVSARLCPPAPPEDRSRPRAPAIRADRDGDRLPAAGRGLATLPGRSVPMHWRVRCRIFFHALYFVTDGAKMPRSKDDGAAGVPSGVAPPKVIEGTTPFVKRLPGCFQPFRPDRAGERRPR